MESTPFPIGWERVIKQRHSRGIPWVFQRVLFPCNHHGLLRQANCLGDIDSKMAWRIGPQIF